MVNAIEIECLYKLYKNAESPAVNNFSFTVKSEHVMGLLGPNGAGKTTIISILCGLTTGYNGSAHILGKDCHKEQDAIRKVIGVVPQQIALFGDLSAIENFKYIGRLYNLPEHITRQRITSLLERLGLEKHANKKINQYSGGMKRRANIIGSLLHEPALLILDEPTAGVDVQSRAMIIDFLKDYKQQGKTILYTSHLMEEAQQICDEVVIIDQGKFIVNGTPTALINNTPGCNRLEDVFLYYTGHTVRE